MPEGEPDLDVPLLSSGYVQRAEGVLPKQAKADPWRETQDYLKDRKTIRQAPLDDGVLQFRALSEAPALAEAAE
jgi:cyclohexanone monooxygenase